MKKLDMILGGIELLVGVGVGTLVSSVLGIVKPANLGAIKKIAVGMAGMAISCMAVDKVNSYVDKSFCETARQVAEIFTKKPETEKETEEEEDEEAL